MNLQDITVEKLLPLFMRRDPANVAAAQVAGEALQALAEGIAKLSTWDALALLSEAELDALADELRVLWYGEATTLTAKRALLLTSDDVYMRMGTVSATRDVIASVFGSARLEEFFRYAGGRPHYFRVVVESPSELTADSEARLLSLLSMTGRKSQWLEKILAETRADISAHIGVSLATSTRTTISIS